MVGYRDPELTTSHGHTEATTTPVQLTLKMTRRLAEQTSAASHGENCTSKRVGGVGLWLGA